MKKKIRLFFRKINGRKKEIASWTTILFFVLACPGIATLVEASINRETDEMWFPTGAGSLNPNDPLAWRMDERRGSFKNSIKSFSAMSTMLISESGFDPAPPSEADIGVDDTVVITPEIEALVEELKYDPLKIFYWVHNNIKIDFYHGSRGGSVGALEKMEGNQYDQCSLLIALLRAAGLHTRYARGWAELSEEKLMNWTGGNTPYAAANVIWKRYNDIEYVSQDKLLFKHIGVNVFNIYGEGKWTLLDPSYKIHEYTEKKVDTSNEEIAQDLIDSVQQIGDSLLIDTASVNEALQAQLDHTVDVAEGLTMEDLLRTQKIKQINKTEYEKIIKLFNAYIFAIFYCKETIEYLKKKRDAISGNFFSYFKKRRIKKGIKRWEKYLSYLSRLISALTLPELYEGPPNILVPTEEFAFLPEDVKAKIKIIMPGGEELTMSTSDLSGKNLSIVYDENNAPVFRIDSEVAVIGTTTENTVKVGFLHPWTGRGWKYISKELVVRSRYSLGSHMQRISPEELKRQANELKEEIASLGLSGNEPAPDYIQDKETNLMNKTYFNLYRKFVNDFSKSAKVDWITEAAFGFFSISKDGGREIDIPIFTASPVQLNMTVDDHKEEVIKHWMITAGSIGSNLEHLTIEAMFPKIKAVSTVKIIAEASKRGVPIIVLDNREALETSLSKIEFDETNIADKSIKNLIKAYVEQGYTVVIPAQKIKIELWDGWGWLVATPDFSSLAFQIEGGINGGYTTEPIDNEVSTVVKTAIKVWETGDLISATAAITITAGTKAYAGYYVAVQLSGTSLAAVGTGLLVGQVVVATLLVVAGGIILITLLDSIWGTHSAINRRWHDDEIYYEIAYA
ncbi:transglutaminase domain-containing protein [Candidatus Parcubacteria bacterium]|nr:transglutaminase domain-containing protein [Candidatus Parcubacteria bacterium]